MLIAITCPSCATPLEIESAEPVDAVTCPCGHRVDVPASAWSTAPIVRVAARPYHAEPKPRTNAVARLVGFLLFGFLTLVCFAFGLYLGVAVFGALTIVVLVAR